MGEKGLKLKICWVLSVPLLLFEEFVEVGSATRGGVLTELKTSLFFFLLPFNSQFQNSEIVVHHGDLCCILVKICANFELWR